MKKLCKVLLPIVAVSAAFAGHVPLAIFAAMGTVIVYVLPDLFLKN